MRILPTIVLCGLIALTASAQRYGGAGGGRGGGGVITGGGIRTGGGIGPGGIHTGGGIHIGVGPGGGVGYPGGIRIGSGHGLRSGNYYGARRGYGSFGYAAVGYPYFGYGLGPYQPSFWDYSSYSIGYGSYGAGFAEPNVTVVYPPEAAPAATPVVIRANPVIREYNERGEEIGAQPPPAQAESASPIYLIAFKDETIRAVMSYRVDGAKLRYVTAHKEEREAPLDSVDRDLSRRLNRERRIPFDI